MKYSDILAEGCGAFWAEEPRNSNPYPYQTVAWWAWDNGWLEGRSELRKAELVHAEGRP